MRCVGYGKKAVAAAKDAELSAIRTLLFEGVTNTQYTMPLISEDRLTVEAKFKKFFDDFYNGIHNKNLLNKYPIKILA